MQKISDIKKTINLLLKKRLDNVDKISGLDNKVVLITGASKGLGLATGLYLLDQGCKVIFLSRDTVEIKDDLSGKNPEKYLLVDTDIQDVAQINKAVEKTLEKFGHIDVLINNAGIFTHEPFIEAGKSIDLTIDTNIKGTINTTKAVLKDMLKRKNGLVINIGSKISHNTNVQPNKVLYATSKYAIEGFSYALNKELKNDNIRVVCLMPGTINSFVSLKSGDYMAPTRVAQIIAMIMTFEDIDFEGIIFKSALQDI